jgi:hypothetical protein
LGSTPTVGVGVPVGLVEGEADGFADELSVGVGNADWVGDGSLMAGSSRSALSSLAAAGEELLGCGRKV